MQFVELFLNSLMLWSVAIVVGRMLLESKEKVNVITKIFIVLVFTTILSILNLRTFNIISGPIKVIFVYLLQCTFYKLIFSQSLSKVIMISLIWYLSLVISELIIAITVSVITYFTKSSMTFIINNILLNILIVCSIIIIIKIFKNKLISLLKNNSKIKINISTFIVIFTTLITVSLISFKIPYNEWEFSLEFIITMLIALGVSVVCFTLLKQRAQIQETTSKYQQLANYSDVTNELLENYRLVSHEHKNQLLIIRSLIDKNKKELINYVDGLLDKNESIKYPWIGQLNHLPVSGLKGLINYKLMEMERKNLNVNITVSTDLIKSKLNKLTIKEKDALYSIMGVYLDNAIQAAEKSSKQEISLEIFKENKEIVIILANSYSGKIDLEKIDEYGYTTKGKNHGVGLHIVKKIIEKENIFSQVRNVLDDYYIQELRIDLSNIKANKKAIK